MGEGHGRHAATPAAGTGATGAEAAAALAEIQRRQEQVIKAVLVPGWYWWAIAAAMVAIGAARDSGDLVVQAITIPLAVLVMAVLTGAMIPDYAAASRCTRHAAPRPRRRRDIRHDIAGRRGDIGTAASLAAARVPYPVTIGSAAGAAVLVIAGPLVNRYLRRLMLSQARQQINDAPQAGGTP